MGATRGRPRLRRPALPRFARTVTFKLALVQAGLFTASASVLFAAVFVSLTGYASTQLRSAIAAELSTLAEERASDGLNEFTDTMRARANENRSGGFVYLLRGADGTRLFGSLAPEGVRAGWQDLPSPTPANGGGRERGWLEVLGQPLPTGEFLAVGRDLGDAAHVKEQVVRSFGLAAALTLILAIVSGALSSLAALRRVEAINVITRGIMEGDLSRRVPERGTGDEFDRLAANTNAMLDRIQLLMEGLRQVSNDIAHDLRTPLTHLRQRLEVARGGPRNLDAYEAAIEAASGDADAILRIFASLLRIAQVEAGTRRAGFTDLDLSAVFSSIAEVYGPVAEDEGQTFEARIAPDLTLRGDRDLVTQMLANLVENAIRHAGPGARIALCLERDGAGFRGIVSDTGPGIPEDARSRVFGRFVRLDASRPGEGHGLGLAMVKAVADLHGIAIALSDEGPGLRVTLCGPSAPRPA